MRVVFGFVLFGMLTSACSSTNGGPGNSGNASSASSPPDPSAFCATYCGRRSDCDRGEDLDTCESRCASENAASLPKFNGELVSSTTSCLKSADCHTILEENAVGNCLKVALVSIAPGSAAKEFCDAFGGAVTKCGGDHDDAACLEIAKRYNDGALASAKSCTEKTCNQLGGCVDAVLGLK